VPLIQNYIKKIKFKCLFITVFCVNTESHITKLHKKKYNSLSTEKQGMQGTYTSRTLSHISHRNMKIDVKSFYVSELEIMNIIRQNILSFSSRCL